MPNGRLRKNCRGKTRTTTSPPTSPPPNSGQIPPQPAQRYQCPDSDSQANSSDNDPSRMDLDGVDATSPLFPPLTSDSPTPGPNQPAFPTNVSNLFSPVVPREESQGAPSSLQVNGKRKQSDPSQNTPAPQTPLRSHSNQPSPHSPGDGAGQRSVNMPSSLPNIQAITFGQPNYSPGQRSASHFDSLMDQDDVNPDKDITGFFGNNPLIDLRSEMRLGWKDLDKPKAIVIPYRATYLSSDTILLVFFVHFDPTLFHIPYPPFSFMFSLVMFIPFMPSRCRVWIW